MAGLEFEHEPDRVRAGRSDRGDDEVRLSPVWLIQQPAAIARNADERRVEANAAAVALAIRDQRAGVPPCEEGAQLGEGIGEIQRDVDLGRGGKREVDACRFVVKVLRHVVELLLRVSVFLVERDFGDDGASAARSKVVHADCSTW